MTKTITIAIAAMLIGGSAYAGDVIAPPVTKYVEAPLPPKRPLCFSKDDCKKVVEKVQEVTTKK